MPYRFLADIVVVVHFCVVIFVVLGGILVVRYRRVAWIHLPIIAWVVFAELFQHICPLTYLENWLRDRGAMETYRGDFVAHYIMPVLYPDGLTPRIQIAFGTAVLLINASLYGFAFLCKRGAGVPRRPQPLRDGSCAPGGERGNRIGRTPDSA